MEGTTNEIEKNAGRIPPHNLRYQEEQLNEQH